MPYVVPFLALAFGLTSSLAAAHPAGGELRLEGGQAGAQFGSALATGDVNGDGFGDLVVGAPGFDARVSDEGRVTLYLGSAAGLSLVPSWSATGLEPFEHFGTSLSIADVNGDGRDDVLVSSPDFDRRPSSRALLASLGHGQGNGLSSEGRVTVYLGTPAGLAATPQRVISGIEFGERFGAALTGAGDVNGDGYEDVLVGATGKLQGLGGVFLFAGSPSGLRALPGWIRIGSSIGEGWGGVLASVGDVDGDGFDDFVASAPERGPGGASELFLGSVLGPGIAPDRTFAEKMILLGPTANIDLVDVPESLYVGALNAVVWEHFSGGGGATFPAMPHEVRALSCGDLNHDGRRDILVGTPAFDYGPFHGRVWVYTNQPGQSFSSPAAPFPVFDGDQAGAEWGAALAAIDVDGDGDDELFIGAPLYDTGGTDAGLVALEPGHEAELSLTTTGPTLAIPTSVSASGDFDGDGYDDLLSSTDSGIEQQLELRYGSPSGLPAQRDARLNLPSFAAFNLLTIALATGDFDGDGFDDVLASFFPSNYFGHGGYRASDEQHRLYLGSSAGLATDPAVDLTSWGFATNATNVGDVNGDGREDLVVLRNSTAEVHLGNASSGLNSAPDQVFPGGVTNSGRVVLAGKLNGDGFGDVVLVLDQGTRVLSLLGSPSGLALQLTQTNFPLYCAVDFLTDVNGDGIDDLLLRERTNGDKYRTYLGSPAGFTASAQWWEDPSGPPLANGFVDNPIKAVLDVDGDGFDDVLISGNRLHLGSAQGLRRGPSWWAPSSAFPVPSPILTVFNLTHGDFDGDGWLEVLVQVSPDSPNWTVREFGPR